MQEEKVPPLSPPLPAVRVLGRSDKMSRLQPTTLAKHIQPPPPYKPRNHTDLQIESTAAEMLAHDLSLVATASLAHSYTAIVLRTEHAPISGLQYGRARKSVETCPAVGVPKKRKRASPTLCQQPAAPA